MNCKLLPMSNKNKYKLFFFLTITIFKIIVDGINYMRYAAYLLLELNEFLKTYFLKECRYDTFYIFKAAIIRINQLKE